MGTIRDAATATYADGPSTTPDEPDKVLIRNLFGTVEDAINAGDSALQATIDNGNAALTAKDAELAGADTALGLRIDDVESLVTVGVKPKEAVRVATKANTSVTSGLENGDTVDGVVLATGDRVALLGQTFASQNGVWIVQSSGTAVRATDMDGDDELAGATFFVLEGTYAGTRWQCSTEAPITVGTTDLVFVQIGSTDALPDGAVSNTKLAAMTAKSFKASEDGTPADLTVPDARALLTAPYDADESDLPGTVLAYDRVTDKILALFETGTGHLRIPRGLKPYIADAGEEGYYDLIAFPDSDGSSRAPIAVRKTDGKLQLGPLDETTVDMIAAQIAGGNAVQPVTSLLASSTMLFSPIAGQSNTVGGGLTVAALAGNPGIVTTRQPHPYAYTLNTGARGVGGSVLDPDTLTGFIPHQERWDGSLGETPCGGLATQLCALESAFGVLRPLVSRSHGQAGRTIAQLDKAGGLQPYKNGLMEIEKVVELAAAAGYTVSAPFIHWDQGEADRSATTAKATYVAAFEQLKTDYNADWLAYLPGSHAAIGMIISQLAAMPDGVGSEISIAHYELARDVAGVYLACPNYIFDYIAGDTVHFTAASAALKGEYHAKQAYRTLREAAGSQALMPTNLSRSTTTITLTIAPKAGNLVIDTTTLAAATDYGFTYTGANITAVTITDAATGAVEITLDADAAGTLRYAYTGAGASGRPGAWGNLRDEDNVASLTSPGKMLWNWLAIFEEEVA